MLQKERTPVSRHVLLRRLRNPNRNFVRREPEHVDAVLDRQRLDFTTARFRQLQILMAAAHVPERHPGMARERVRRGQLLQLQRERLRPVGTRQLRKMVDPHRRSLAAVSPPAGRARVDYRAAR